MSDPTYTIAVSWNNDILVLTLSGLASKQNTQEIMQAITGLCLENRPTKLLVDCRNLQGRLGILDTYLAMKDYPLKDKFIVPKIAIIDVPENRNESSFHETAIRNIGLNIRYFLTETEAVAWLNGASE